MHKHKKSYSSLENALRLLNLFTIDKPEFHLNKLAEELSIASSTAHRLLTTLRTEGFIAKDSLTGKYRLGISIRSLESIILRKMDLFRLSQEVLEQTAMRTNLSASLAVVFKNSTFYLNAVEANNVLFNKLTYIGKQCSFFDSSAGKILFLGRRGMDSQSQDVDPSTVSTLDTQLQQNGYIQTNHDYPLGISTMAVPIKNKWEETIAALELIGTEKQVHAHVEALKEAGEKLSSNLKISKVTELY